MNNFLGEEDINPRGWHQDPPGRRLPTMMCPALVKTRQGGLVALGTGGSNRIRSAILQTLLQVLDLELSPEQAVAAPRLHRERDGCWMETTGLPPVTVEALRQDYPGLRTHDSASVFFGGVHLAELSSEGEGSGAGDPRRGGVVEVLP
jgi:gamma-glutamyltranspeptidase/glutathione hydrolase